MSNIQKWTIKQWILSKPDAFPSSRNNTLTGYQDCTLRIDFDNKKYQIDYPDGRSVSGTIQTFLEYKASMPGVFGFFDTNSKTPILFGTTSLINGTWPINKTPVGQRRLMVGDSHASTDLWEQTATASKYIKGFGAYSSLTGYTQIPSGTQVPPICYLSGTLIATPAGERSIESLNPGDEIIVLRHGSNAIERLIWVGRGVKNVATAENAPDEAGYPICISKDSLGSGVPYQDLYVTPEHSMYFDGMFVPARMLVNNATIFYDRKIQKYSYFHIETQAHDLIYANGALSESFLDTGNRALMLGRFLEAGAPIERRNKTWSDACAPLCVDSAIVKRLWQKFAGHALPKAARAAVPDSSSAFILRDQNGVDFYPIRSKGSTYIFSLKHGDGVYTIVSSRHRPCDVVGPFIDDRRYLGLLVSSIMVWGESKSYTIDLDDNSVHHRGWQRQHSSNEYWTDGSAQFTIDGDHESCLISLQAVPYLETICREPQNSPLVVRRA